MELEEAVKNINDYIFAIDNFGTIDPKCCNNLYEPVKVVLKELDKRDKVINEMAREFYAENIYIGYSNFRWKNSSEEVKQYFYKKVEEQE